MLKVHAIDGVTPVVTGSRPLPTIARAGETG